MARDEVKLGKLAAEFQHAGQRIDKPSRTEQPTDDAAMFEIAVDEQVQSTDDSRLARAGAFADVSLNGGQLVGKQEADATVKLRDGVLGDGRRIGVARGDYELGPIAERGIDGRRDVERRANQVGRQAGGRLQQTGFVLLL
ncbi:MAG: hypothetical protein QM775_15520 [Pirellulales bacterium]